MGNLRTALLLAASVLLGSAAGVTAARANVILPVDEFGNRTFGFDPSNPANPGQVVLCETALATDPTGAVTGCDGAISDVLDFTATGFTFVSDSDGGADAPADIDLSNVQLGSNVVYLLEGPLADGSIGALYQPGSNDPGFFPISVEGSLLYNIVSDPASVPEPTTLGIFGVGLAGLGWMRRRRKSA